MLKNFTLLFTLLVVSLTGFGQSETFSNIITGAGSYAQRDWTGDNGLPWRATDARTDQTITAGNPAITIRDGSVTCNGIPGGISSLAFTHQQKFTGSGSVLQVYINGTLVGTANPTTTVATASISSLNINGNFDLEIRQTTPGLRIAIDDVTWTAFNNNPPCAEPAAQPTNLILSSSPNSITGSFTAPVPEADAYLIVRSTAATLSATPADGTVYNAGQAFGGGTVIGYSSVNNFTDNSLNPSTTYYYFIFAISDEDCTGGPNYFNNNPLSGSTNTQPIPPCTTPASPTSLNLTPANNSITGSFTGVAGINRYLVVISTSATLGATPVDGVNYTQGQALGSGTVVSFNNSTGFSATGLTTSTVYYLFVFAGASECTGQPLFNTTSLNGSVTTTNSSTGIPAGYYNAADGLTCQPLKTALKTIISTGAVNIGYDGLWTAYRYTDIKPGSTDTIWDIYTDDNNPAVPETFNFIYGTKQCGTYNSEGDCYNREHTTPKSWFNDAAPMHNDIFHVLPTDGWVNGARSNWPYGEVTNATFTSIDNQSKRGTGNNFGYTGTVFQPNAAFRGDVARISLYMATRYEDQIISQNWAGGSEANAAMLGASEEGFDAARRRLQIYDTWYIRTMFKWMTEDPVSQKEIDRNNAVYNLSGQHNRNPFVDHPEYAALIWQCTGVLPVTITDFVGQKQSNNVLLKWYATYETGFKTFEIERSLDADGFYKIGEVAGQNLANYAFTDAALPNTSIVYYRLKMIDIDGTYSYSKTVPVRLNNNFSNALVYPNPTTGPLNVRLTQAIKANTSLVITDVAGRTVQQQQVNKGVFSINLEVSKLPAGRYFIRINNDRDVIRQSFVIIK